MADPNESLQIFETHYL